VEVTLTNLTHYRPEDLDVLLVSPSGTNIILMSDAGGYTPATGATLVFHPNWQSYGYPPYGSAIPSSMVSDYTAANYDNQQHMPSPAPAGPYALDLNDLVGTNPNGLWNLYIYDRTHGDAGALEDSWRLRFHYQ
jgi:subtilisin-like proprotein convertase family protein